MLGSNERLRQKITGPVLFAFTAVNLLTTQIFVKRFFLLFEIGLVIIYYNFILRFGNYSPLCHCYDQSVQLPEQVRETFPA